MVKLILAVQGTAPVQIRPGRRGFTPVNVTCASAVYDVFQTLLTAGANAQKANQVGEWGLQWAVLNGSVAIVVLLLAAGADPNFRNREGYEPL